MFETSPNKRKQTNKYFGCKMTMWPLLCMQHDQQLLQHDPVPPSSAHLQGNGLMQSRKQDKVTRPSQPNKTQHFTTLHNISLYQTPHQNKHCTTFHNTSQHFTTFHNTSLDQTLNNTSQTRPPRHFRGALDHPASLQYFLLWHKKVFKTKFIPSNYVCFRRQPLQLPPQANLH